MQFTHNTRRCRVQGAECSTDTSIWQRAGREGASRDWWSDETRAEALINHWRCDKYRRIHTVDKRTHRHSLASLLGTPINTCTWPCHMEEMSLIHEQLAASAKMSDITYWWSTVHRQFETQVVEMSLKNLSYIHWTHFRCCPMWPLPLCGLWKYPSVKGCQNGTPLSIIQCYSCEECPDKTMRERWIDCTQDAEYVRICSQTLLGGIPRGTRVNFKVKQEQIMKPCLLYTHTHKGDLLVPWFKQKNVFIFRVFFTL